MRRCAVALLYVVSALWVPCVAGDPGADGGAPRAEAPGERFESRRTDPSWCGPRIVYFFACYLERRGSFELVAEECRTDEEGHTTLQNLVGACDRLGLEPTPVSCPPDDLLKLGGPAILCVRRTKGRDGSGPRDGADEQEGAGLLHFIGLIGRDGDKYLVFDPAANYRAYRVPGETITTSYTGRAVLLKGCPRPDVQPRWRTFLEVVLPPTMLSVLALGLIRHIARRLRGAARVQ